MPLPLEGIRVLDLSQVLPGGLCTQILADLGADVIKIENPDGGDSFRKAPPLLDGTGSFFLVVNRNKRSMTLNMNQEEGRAILQRMGPEADVLLENFRPGTMDCWGLGYDALRRLNPRIVYCSLTGFGQDGPYSGKPSHDLNILAVSGILDLLRERGRLPLVPAVQIAGAGGAIQAALGILAALLRRHLCGSGQYLDVSLLDGLSPFLGLIMSEFAVRGIAPGRGEARVGGGYACYNVYETKDSRLIALGCLEEKFWSSFCRAVGREDLVGDLLAPLDRQGEMIAELRAVFRRRTRAEWVELLDRCDVCFSTVNSLEDVREDPRVSHRALWYEAPHSGGRRMLQQAFPVKFSDEEPGWRTPPPALGEHTLEILENLRFDAAAVADLKKRGIV
jgi:crotonobetainyl-CoA:carnitine CoA-transferase CaiB-like acyl-CoA transferase